MKYPNLLDQFEMIMQHVQDENYPEATATVATFKMRLEALEAELKQKDEKLSEFENGLPIEKAKEGEVYAALIFRGHQNPSFLICQAFKSPLDQKIRFQIACGEIYEGKNIIKLIPLPPKKNTETQEGS